MVFYHVPHCGNAGVERYRNKTKKQRKKLTLEKERSPSALGGVEPATLQSRACWATISPPQSRVYLASIQTLIYTSTQLSTKLWLCGKILVTALVPLPARAVLTWSKSKKSLPRHRHWDRYPSDSHTRFKYCADLTFTRCSFWMWTGPSHSERFKHRLTKESSSTSPVCVTHC